MISSTNYCHPPSRYQQSSCYSSFNANSFGNQAIIPKYLQAHHSALVHQHNQSLIRPRFRIMAQMTPAEMEEFQNLSDRYQADLPGPLIGEKLPMDVLVTEYAQADPTFVVKTTGLAATHSAYRAVKGDGQCGWRATVFSYFELLLHSGDPGLVQLEKIRFETFADTMTQIGMDYELLAVMFDYTWELFDKIIEAVQNNVPDDNIVLNILNDENPSNSVIYHFKMVTSAYMQLHPDEYEPFLEMPVDQYCVARIDPANQEIDQIGLQALTHAVISAAGFGLEVLYLDRSMGEEVTPHQFSQTGNGVPTIRLLYRPGHYDIIYKGNQAIEVFLQSDQGIQHIDAARGVTSSSGVLDALFSPATMPASSAQSSYGVYDAPGQYTHHLGYGNFYQPPMYADMSWYQPPAQQPMPPPISMPVEPPAQLNSHASTAQSHSSRSVTLSPSPPTTVAITNQPQIRFSSSMYHRNMRNHRTAPTGPCTGR